MELTVFLCQLHFAFFSPQVFLELLNFSTCHLQGYHENACVSAREFVAEEGIVL